MKRHERSAPIFHFVLVGIFVALLSISDSAQTQRILYVSMLLVGCVYNWITGFWSLLQSLSFVSVVLGCALWVWSAPEGRRPPWLGGVVLFLGFLLTLVIDASKGRAALGTTATPPAG